MGESTATDSTKYESRENRNRRFRDRRYYEGCPTSATAEVSVSNRGCTRCTARIKSRLLQMDGIFLIAPPSTL